VLLGELVADGFLESEDFAGKVVKVAFPVFPVLPLDISLGFVSRLDVVAELGAAVVVDVVASEATMVGSILIVVPAATAEFPKVVVAAFRKGATTHCEHSALSTNFPFCSVGVKLNTYELLKLPAPQPM
jgi:hypothetical protein